MHKCDSPVEAAMAVMWCAFDVITSSTMTAPSHVTRICNNRKIEGNRVIDRRAGSAERTGSNDSSELETPDSNASFIMIHSSSLTDTEELPPIIPQINRLILYFGTIRSKRRVP